jgi:type VI protein secretion system component Hcp
MHKSLVLLTAAVIVVTAPIAANAGGRGGGGGNSGAAVTHQDFQINKYQDVASPKLYMLHNGTHIPKATVYDKHKDW